MFSLYNINFICYSKFLVALARREGGPGEQLGVACGLQAMPELLYFTRRME
jgi:hypothetical protein